MRAGITVSVALHAGVAMAGIVALPSAPPAFEDVVIIPVTLITVAPGKPPPADDPPQPAAPPTAKSPPTAPAPAPAPAPADTQEVTVPADTAQSLLEPDAETETQKQARARLATRFDSILKSVERQKKQESQPRIDPFDSIPSEDEIEPPRAVASNENQDDAIPKTLGSAHLQSLVKLRIERDCWRDPSDMADAERLHALISFELTRAGTLTGPPRLLSPASVSQDESQRVFVQRAFRAIRTCAPYDFLPAQRYAEWRKINVNFSGVPQ